MVKKSRVPKLTKAERKQRDIKIYTRYRQHPSCRDLAPEFGVSAQTISDVVRKVEAAGLYVLPSMDGRAPILEPLPDRTYEPSTHPASESLWAFVRFIWPHFDWHWHHKIICMTCDRLLFGDVSNVMIFAPPRHGKSQIVSRALPAFAFGHFPNWEIRFSANVARLAMKMNKAVQAVMDSERYRQVFPKVSIPSGLRRSGEARLRNREGFQICTPGCTGEYACSGVGASIVGTGFDLGIIDDPIEGYKQSTSPSQKEDLFEWFKSDFMSREGPAPKTLVMHQRWCPDDLAGRLLTWQDTDEDAPRWEVVSLPAEMVPGYQYRHPEDPRKPGEMLWPGRFPKKKLAKYKADLRTWNALYQQIPVDSEALMFDPKKWRYCDPEEVPKDLKILRFWDLSGTKTGDPWCGVKMGRTSLGLYYVLDCAWWHAGPAEGDELLSQCADEDGLFVPQYLEEERGGSGKLVTSHYRRSVLPQHKVVGVPVAGSKELRASPYSSAQSSGGVVLVRAPWNKTFVAEHSQFPDATHDDRVDAASGAFGVLASKRVFRGGVTRASHGLVKSAV